MDGWMVVGQWPVHQSVLEEAGGRTRRTSDGKLIAQLDVCKLG